MRRASVVVIVVVLTIVGVGWKLGWGIYPQLWRTIAGPRSRPLRAVQFQATQERIARGRYLAEGVLTCTRCHSDRNWSEDGGPPVQPWVGHRFGEIEKPWMVAPNLTSDPETGAARWTDDMLARAIREGVGHDGRALDPNMWYRAFSGLADEDLVAVVTYVRTIAPIRNALPQTREPWQRRFTVNSMPQPITQTQGAPDQSTPVKRGQYLEFIADCAGCHTDWYHPGSAVNGQIFAGGNELWAPGGVVFSPNITPDPSGISYYDEAQFIRVMRTGKVGARNLSPIMPWQWYRNMSDDDLKAVFAWLRVQSPVKHIVDNTESPTYCKLCQQKHGGGDRN